ncbi:DUF3667 domain-containing protein [Aquimarina sp. BL5]|uniref:DUF3667 domain-containing protein n=1 Tax=Aquimarina sp. BL5 TaxID=1714860 RepID=UPI000E47263E|nr:DUF3667 domain-containing protein [Aquimarina sp. BL5]AXT49746.1 DUF3667 domain-containing protein [Aquimarina sp. BL5]RKM97612.1 DUF3667 domain-containing protein [Aquimarina sp. BL5]
MSTTYQCKNCEQSFDESFDYCPYCGQETADKLTFGVLFSNTIGNYFAVDARFFKSFIPLMTKPGILARLFVDGKRLSYLHPAQFYLFISVVFFFAFSFTVRKADDNLNKTIKKEFSKENSLDPEEIKKDSIGLEIAKNALTKNVGLAKIAEKDLKVFDSVLSAEQRSSENSFSFKRKELDSLIEVGAPQEEKLKVMGVDEDDGIIAKTFVAQILKFYEQKGGGILKTLYDTIPITMFLMLPLFAFILKIFYWKRATFAHHMVFSFYFFTFVFTSLCFLILMNSIVGIPIWLQVLFFLSFIIYLIIAFRNFYKSSWIGAFFRGLLVAYVYMIVIVPFAFIGVIFVSIFLY